MNTNALNHVVGHAIATLPDSIKARREILRSILELLPAAHQLRLPVDEMVRWLDGQEKHQLQLSLDFPRLNKSNPAHDGDGQ